MSEWTLWTGVRLSHLMFDEARLVFNSEYGYGSTIVDPTWEEVQTILGLINGEELNEVALSHPSYGTLMVGGGNEGKYIIVYFPLEEKPSSSLTLVNLKTESIKGFINLRVQIPSDYPAKYGVTLEAVVDVCQVFFSTGSIPQDAKFKWEEE
ncbi:MAG: hypothetical protein HC828_05095 [Blastochloris sp.]|nr:hypothetical protein [Blastochloris sp.]